MSAVTSVRPLAISGLGSSVAGVFALAALHVLPPTDRLSPIRRAISDYALHETAWLFNVGVLAVALGSFAVLLAVTRAGLARLTSLGGIGVVVWCLSLAGVVIFPPHNWAIGPSASGEIHRAASLLAFLALPLGALFIAWAWRADVRWRRCAACAAGFAALALLMFGVIVGAIVLEPVTGVSWWRAIPLGAVERCLAAAEVLTVLTLGWWASKATEPRK